MQLDIITPDKKVFSGEVTSVTVPGVNGQFQVLKGHAAIISTLENGTISVQAGQQQYQFESEGGVVEVLNDNIVVLVERSSGSATEN